MASASPSRTTPPTSVTKRPRTSDADLPFEKKNTHLWSVLESKEVFRKLPQKPHFRPLEQFNDIFREGEAIGCMVNFCSVLERSSTLQFLNEPKSCTNQLLESVSELEENGFHLEVVRQRIAMKEKMEKLREQLEEVMAEFQTSVASLGITAGVNLDIGSISGKSGNEKSDRRELVSAANDKGLDAEKSPVGQLSLGSGQKRKGTMPRKYDDFVVSSDVPTKRKKITVWRGTLI